MTRLEELLDLAAEALLAGDMARLAALTPEMEQALPPPCDQITAARLQAKARRNARLLEAAGRGVRAARHRMAEITRGPTLTTYDSRGQKAAIAPVATIPARRV